MTPQTKLAMRRWALRQARYLFDAIEERLHAAEVRLREDIAGREGKPCRQTAPRAASLLERDSLAARGSETFEQWEARRSGFSSLPRKCREPKWPMQYRRSI
jgi:hypothetical protein